MASSSVSTVYLQVIGDVISKVREEFVNSEAGDNVLRKLQELWEMKMLQCGAISGSIERERSSLPKPAGPIAPVHDLNVPYDGPVEEYETPTAEMLFPPTPLQTPMRSPLPGAAQTPLPGNVRTPLPGTAQTPLPGTAQSPLPGTDHSVYNIPISPSGYAPLNDIRNGLDVKTGRTGAYMQSPSPWMNQRSRGVDVNVAYVEGHDEVERGAPHQHLSQDFFMMSSGKRKREDYASQLRSGGYIPQQDGNVDTTIECFLPKTGQGNKSSTGGGRETEATATISHKQAREIPMLPQKDGIHDEYDLFPYQGVATEDYNTPTPADHAELRAGTPSAGTPKPPKTEAVDDDEPPLNEDDDDDLDDLEEGEEEPNKQHLVLAQFDKVTRTKSKWKCTLKGGIMHINNRDILFNKATGEFDF